MRDRPVLDDSVLDGSVLDGSVLAGSVLDPAALARAVELDAADPLASLRKRFATPASPVDEPLVYLAGNSLGLMPHRARSEVVDVLDNWAIHAVEGHFLPGEQGWYRFDEPIAQALAPIVGAAPNEVALMGSLTENLHLLLASFYRPTSERNLLVIEADAFPSDRYMATSHVQWHGLDPDTAVYELTPDQTTADGFASFMATHGARVAVVLLGGVNYLDGRVLPMPAIAAAAHRAGALVGYDLAHAAGNVALDLHEWGVDFAAWCSYKYLNAGPGATAAIFVHERHGLDPDRHRLAGWWGNNPDTRFAMDTERDFVAAPGADGFKVSNPAILALAPLRASLEIFAEAGDARLEKSAALTAYLRELLVPLAGIEVLTPGDASGAQTSVRIPIDARVAQTALHERGVLCDMRPPDVLRLAPTALYNSFGDVARTVVALEHVLAEAMPVG